MKHLFTLFFILVSLTVPQLEAKPIELVWQADRTSSWEEDWLNELLLGIDLKVVDDGKFQTFADRSIIVVSSLQNSSKVESYLKKLHKKKCLFGVILLSDERYIIPKSFAKYAMFVFRNYWHKDFSKIHNLTVFPLGYKTGFWKDGKASIKHAKERDFTWCFAGQIAKKPTREAMISSLKELPGFHIHETFQWDDPNALDVLDYRNLLLNTVFLPCPKGNWNLDSFRVYEALECGCIPIVEKNPIDYFSDYFKDHPFITVDSWDMAPDLMKELLDNPDLLEKRRAACYQWWQKTKKRVHQQLIDTINCSF